jgi:predicted enzyme related to lactoylglutathione lyase
MRLPISGEKDVVGFHGRFAWYDLLTTDMEAAKAFYTKVMGWGALDASLPSRAYSLFAVGNALVGGLMELPEEVRKMGAKPGWLGYVVVDDVDAAAERIRRLGGTVLVPPTDIPSISRFSIFADPQGARLALLKWQRPGPALHADLDGPVGWHEQLAADREQALSFYSGLFGWQRTDVGTEEVGTYWLFSVDGQEIGGVLTQPPEVADPFWLYYFNVSDLDAAAQRVKTCGGEILDGPFEVLGGTCVVRCNDPQGAKFALEGRLGRRAVGYFERVGADPADKHRRRWSW